jgi:hypothetical protein
VVNLPEHGRYAVSLFAHHGDKDTTVPPGDWGEDDFVYQSPQFESDGYQTMVDASFPTSLDYRPGYLPLGQGSKAYRTYDNVDGHSPFRLRTGIKGMNQAKSKSWPDAENWDGLNPTVVIYRDFEMEHTNFTDPGNRYFFEKDGVALFRAPPSGPALGPAARSPMRSVMGARELREERIALPSIRIPGEGS